MLKPQAEEIIVEEQPKEAPKNRSKVFCVFCDKVPPTSAKLLTRLQKKKTKPKKEKKTLTGYDMLPDQPPTNANLVCTI